MLVMLSSLPDTRVEQFLRDLIEHSDEPLTSALKSLDLKKEKIKSPKDMILFLLMNKDKEMYPEEGIFKSIANLIIARDIPGDSFTSQLTTEKKSRLWILWIFLGASGLFFFFFFSRKRKKNNEKIS